MLQSNHLQELQLASGLPSVEWLQFDLDIEDWMDKTRYEVAGWIQKIDEFYKNAPQVDMGDEDRC